MNIKTNPRILMLKSHACREFLFFWKKNRYIEFPVTIVDWFNCLIISHPSVKFDSDGSRASKFITFLICYMTLYGHVIDRLCDLIDNSPY